MQYKKIVLVSALICSAALISAQSFVKKKRGGPSVTECCDAGVDVLALSADLVKELEMLQQQLVSISREMIDNNKKCYLAIADKDQLQNYFEKAQQCKEQLLVTTKEVRSFNSYLESTHEKN